MCHILSRIRPGLVIMRRMGDLTQPNSGPSRLRELLSGDRLVIAPGAYDALSARLVEQAGFDLVYMTGYGATASLLGRPDVGLLSMSEMADQARRFVARARPPSSISASA